MAFEQWTIDPSHSRIAFHVRHLMISNVHGQFEKWGGRLELDREQPTHTRVRVEIDAWSVSTLDSKRDAHLRSSEFFDVDRHPTIAFEATEVERNTLDDYEVAGDLTIRGVTRRVVLDVNRSETIVDPLGLQRVAFTVHAAISRKDFGLTWNFMLETGGVMVGDKVTITADLQATRVPELRQEAAK